MKNHKSVRLTTPKNWSLLPGSVRETLFRINNNLDGEDSGFMEHMESANEDPIVCLARSEGKIIGWGLLFEERTFNDARVNMGCPTKSSISMFYVISQYRRQGIALRLARKLKPYLGNGKKFLILGLPVNYDGYGDFQKSINELVENDFAIK